jgi:23S rRNA (cytidine1920-2'-O)/16S rRNA (cytidine1409-2'-O)-methyltransferase
MNEKPYVGRGGEKLKFAIDRLGLDLEGALGADFGCNIGGFTDCMLHEGARRVYAVDTGYGMLEWKLRIDDRVEVMERTNAMHVELPETPDLIAIDVAWTRQRYILPNALRQVSGGGCILSLFKPQYEADDELVRNGVVAPEDFDRVLEETLEELKEMGIEVRQVVRLPHQKKSKNPEAILYIRPQDCAEVPLP